MGSLLHLLCTVPCTECPLFRTACPRGRVGSRSGALPHDASGDDRGLSRGSHRKWMRTRAAAAAANAVSGGMCKCAQLCMGMTRPTLHKVVFVRFWNALQGKEPPECFGRLQRVGEHKREAAWETVKPCLCASFLATAARLDLTELHKLLILTPYRPADHITFIWHHIPLTDVTFIWLALHCITFIWQMNSSKAPYCLRKHFKTNILI